jgi:hypothetical protein
VDVKIPPDITADVTALPERLVDSTEARYLLGNISVPKFRRLTLSGQLKTKKIGRRVYVRADVLRDFIDNLPSAATD